MSETLPKKRPRRDVQSRYADEDKPRVPAFVPPSTERVNPSRVFPNVPGFTALTKNEIRHDSVEIERHTTMAATDLTDSEDDDDTVLPGFIARSARPPCAPESTISRKKARYYHWATHPQSIQSDMKQYRACVEAMESRLSQQAEVDGCWTENEVQARLELQDLQCALSDKSRLLEKEGDALLRILCEELGVVEKTPVVLDQSVSAPPAPIPPKMIRSCTDKAVEQLWQGRQRLAEILDAAAATGAKGQRGSFPSVFVFESSSSGAAGASHDCGEAESKTGTVTEGSDGDDEPRAVGDIQTVLDEFRSFANLARSGKRLPSAQISDEELLAAYQRWIESLVKREPASRATGLGLNQNASDMGELHGRLLREVPLSDSFCAHMLRTLCGVGTDDENAEEFTPESNGMLTQADQPRPQSPRGLVGGRGTRKRRPSTLAAEAGLDIRGIGLTTSAPATEEEERKDNKEKETRPVVSIATSALRRTPRGVPLVLSDCSALEDGYVGRFTGRHGKRNDFIVESTADLLPPFLRSEESIVSRDAQARGALRRAERTLASMEREKAEWLCQLDSSRNIELRASEFLSYLKHSSETQLQRYFGGEHTQVPCEAEIPSTNEKKRQAQSLSQDDNASTDDCGPDLSQASAASAPASVSVSRNSSGGSRKPPRKRR